MSAREWQILSDAWREFDAFAQRRIRAALLFGKPLMDPTEARFAIRFSALGRRVMKLVPLLATLSFGLGLLTVAALFGPTRVSHVLRLPLVWLAVITVGVIIPALLLFALRRSDRANAGRYDNAR